ncbi:GNAT family N-acetyltransferase [Caulobacter mirabilis]|uniref:GNAT family N-acetyltransferase n=1 Tax=Caulobacter mirabilis TaxID=69666 RepID=A0A2D2AW40_9CAUL|nr:GNAT family N-acetyltransferase [Caulobacter mirabilis]ATQ42224.1 GNAT family N-acetyltransferase [Caulobacter mirabilis]
MVDIIALEDVSARAWPSLHRERLGGWRLYASTGHTGRANTCWVLGAPDRPLDDAFRETEAWYAARGLPSKFKTVDGVTPQGFEAELTGRGFSPRTETLVMVGPVGGTSAGVLLGEEPDEPFQAVLFETLYRDKADADERLDTARRIPRPKRFARIDVDGVPAAVGALAVDGDWAGVSLMRTSPNHRRQGLAARIVAALLAEAEAAGARRSYLQVEADNSGAVALYQAMGFAEAYSYRYWAR